MLVEFFENSANIKLDAHFTIVRDNSRRKYMFR